MLNQKIINNKEVVDIRNIIEKLINNITKAVIGKEDVIRMVIVALISGGHVLLEDVPGVGKTLLAKSLAKSINASFKRIQFTSDLLPSDITGTSIYNQKNSEFEFVEGPIFSHIVLADEINRGTPRTQSSLLEAMEELQVSVDGVTRTLLKPFFVIATQNPIESHGTFPLPDSQMDRFMVSLSIGYPNSEDEAKMLSLHKKDSLIDNIETVISIKDILDLNNLVHQVFASDEIYEYIVRIVSATRNHPEIMLGASPRAAVSLLNCAKGYALISNRNYIVPDDLKVIVPYVLSHRIMTYRSYSKSQITELIDKILKTVSIT